MPELDHDWMWVPCPRCGALVGMDCVTVLGVPRDGPHGQRWDLYVAVCCGAVPDPEHQAPAMTGVLGVPRDTLAALPATTEPRPWAPEELTRLAGDFARGHGFAVDQVLVQLPGAERAVPLAEALATYTPPCARTPAEEGWSSHAADVMGDLARTADLARIAALLREDTE